MKRNLIMGILAATLSFTTTSYANFTFHSTEGNACEQIAGQWAGTGKATNWLIGKCIYHGVGVISSSNSSGGFAIEVTADKDSGSSLCPNHTTKRLTGTCINGVVTFMTEYGNLDGSFTQSEGNASGTLSVGPGMKAEVTVNFQRVG